MLPKKLTLGIDVPKANDLKALTGMRAVPVTGPALSPSSISQNLDHGKRDLDSRCSRFLRPYGVLADHVGPSEEQTNEQHLAPA